MPRPREYKTAPAQIPYELAEKLKGSRASLELGVAEGTAADWWQKKQVPAGHVLPEILALINGARIVHDTWASRGLPEMDSIEPAQQPVILSVWRALVRLKASRPEEFATMKALILAMAPEPDTREPRRRRSA